MFKVKVKLDMLDRKMQVLLKDCQKTVTTDILSN